jgi:signal transduction histidine kinase
MNLLSNACKFTADGVISINAWILNPNEVRHIMEREES